MLIFLVHVRDPQFYALPATTRAKNGNIRIMGFPPIGIMSLSAVVKRAGHECVMFDQANPETPNEVIIEEIRKRSPTLSALSFLSTTSYPYAKILARQIRAADSRVARLRRRVRQLNAGSSSCNVRRWTSCAAATANSSSWIFSSASTIPTTVAGLTWAKDGRS